ncbi:MAG: type IV secretion system DNA-binding domain-containing protein [Candidatus Buchananbacteria bacterium]
MPEFNDQDITIFGQTNYRNVERSFGIKRDDRRRHMYIVGKTGMGKTTLLENLIISDIINGEGCCYVDPHGDTAEKLLNFIPSSRVNDVIYLSPSDTEFPISFNVLEAVDESYKHLIASGIVGVFKKQFAESWGPRLEYILRNAVLALLDYPGSTLLGIMRILVDKEYRDKVIEKIKDPVVKSFWTNEYSKWNDRVLQEVISPIQNKVGQFLSNFLIRNIVGQVKSTIDLRDIMDNRKILILNLSKGRIGEDTMQLLGSLIVTKLYLAAMSRVDIPEKERKDFYLYVDEFQNFATDSFASILSEARKYRLNLTVAHQYIEQLPETVSAAIFGNVGTLICFRVGAADAEVLVKEFTPFFVEEDLVNLPSFAVYLKLMIDGIASDPFSSKTLPPLYDSLITNNADKVIKVSRERYAHPRVIVEDKINRWSGIELSDKMVKTVSRDDIESVVAVSQKSTNIKKINLPSGDKAPIKKEDKETARKRIKIVCDLCKKESEIGFEPSPDKPIYCDECFKLIKEERRKKKEDRAVTIDDEMRDLQEVVSQPKEEKIISLDEATSKEPIQFASQSSPKRLAEKPKKAENKIANHPQEILKTPKPEVKERVIDNNSAASVPATPEIERLEWYEQAKDMLKSIKGDEDMDADTGTKNNDKDEKRNASWMD